MNFYNHLNEDLGEYTPETDSFTKLVKDSTYRNVDPAGWAIPVGVIDVLKILDCKLMKITEKDTKSSYTISMDMFIKVGVLSKEDGEDKICAPLEYWEKKDNGK